MNAEFMEASSLAGLRAQLGKMRAERDELAEEARHQRETADAALKGWRAEKAEVERLQKELSVAFSPGMYFDIQKVLDETLGTEECDGAGAGIVADIALLAKQRDEARATLARVREYAEGGCLGSKSTIYNRVGEDLLRIVGRDGGAE